MSTRPKIDLYEPGEAHDSSRFSVRPKLSIEKERADFARQSDIFVICGKDLGFQELKKILQQRGIIDAQNKWTFHDGRLVLLGHLGTTPEMLWFIYSMEEKAHRTGGYIHYVRERTALSDSGRWRNSNPCYAKAPEKARHTRTFLYDGNNELHRWLTTKNEFITIGKIGFVADRNGIAPRAVEMLVSPDHADVRSGLWIPFPVR